MQENNKNRKLTIYLPILFSVILVIGILIGKVFFSGTPDTRLTIYPYKDKLTELIERIENNYVDDVDKQEMVEEVIPKILEGLDPHSFYIPAEEVQKVNEPLQGNFSGIGIQFNMQEDTVVVINTIPNGPSEKIGLMAGDRIVMVDDSVVAGVDMPSDDIVGMLKGKRGTRVNVGIVRKGVDELLEFEITRDNIPLYSVDISYMLDDNTGYIKINKFALTTFEEFEEGIVKVREKGMQNLVIDLRGNGGGYLDAATNIADQFLENGTLIVYTEGRMSARRDYKATNQDLLINTDVVVLIDEASASASEILAGAIQDNDRGLIVGRRSFGKGLVQQSFPLKDQSVVRLTTARYYTPTGRCIQKPYGEDLEDYYNEINERYEHGEFLDSDSIVFADSLMYYTPEGNVVYGGGGIMPDVFIPLDTAGLSEYFTRVKNKGLVYKFAFKFTDQNRDALSVLQTPGQILNYLGNTNLMDQFVAFAEEKGIARDPGGITKSKDLLITQLNAYIARNIIDNEGFFPILHQQDKTLEKAHELVDKE